MWFRSLMKRIEHFLCYGLMTEDEWFAMIQRRERR